MPRFATQEHLDSIAARLADIEDYQGIKPDIVRYIAGLIEAYELTVFASAPAGIEIRYITSEGRDDERWLGALRSHSPGEENVNVWCLTVTLSNMLPFGGDEAVNSFDEPFNLGIDYYCDYDFGTDEVNSESVFDKKVDAVKWLLEDERTCLPHGAEILSGLFRRMIKQFTNASTHIAKGDFAIKIEGL